MRLRRKQLGFLLNPYRHQGATIGRPMSAGGEATTAFRGASVFTSDMQSVAEAGGRFDSQTTSGAGSMVAEAAGTLAGASIASGAFSADAESVATASSEAAAVTVDAADFAGGSNYLLRSSAFSGQASSKACMGSLWLHFDSIQTSIFVAIDGTEFVFQIVYSAPDLHFIANDGAGNTICWIAGDTDVVTGAWLHYLFSMNHDGSAHHHVYINDTASMNVHTSHTGSSIGFAGMDDIRVADDSVNPDAISNFEGGMAEFYFAPGQYLDFSVEANRRKFITADGKPANLGADGSAPTGTVPLIYLRLADGETANNFATNRSGAGNMTVTGSLTTFANSPSD